MTEDRFDEVIDAVRKQGRAAVAAQAAAESCLSVLTRLEAKPVPEALGGSAALLDALLPFLDAFERVSSEARRLAQPGGLSWIARRPSVAALLEGVRLLEAQLGAALASAGVQIDRRVGVSVDAERHRVVNVRSGGRPGVVLEVLRAGYALEGRMVREAEVVVSEDQR